MLGVAEPPGVYIFKRRSVRVGVRVRVRVRVRVGVRRCIRTTSHE